MKNDPPLALAQDMILALALLTRLPMPPAPLDRGARAAWAYPLAGGVVAALAGLAGLAAQFAGQPAPVSALVTLCVLTVLTGAMHEDGLADSADGLWGGWTRDRRLEIMKDSHIGSYGVLALLFGFAARWAGMWMLFETGHEIAFAGILAAAMLSRATMPALMAGLPHARASGLSHGTGRPPVETAALAVLIAGGLAVLLLGWAGIAALIWAGLAGLAVAWIARAKLGGQTGDILGASQQVAEIAVLFALIA